MDALLARFPRLSRLPRVDLGVRATPVETRRIDGLDVLVKRDDMTSAVYGGNKARPLEFLLARPARRVLTFSTLGAHHAYATAVHAARLGLPTTSVIVERGRPGPLLDDLERVSELVVRASGYAGAVLAAIRAYRPGTLVIPPGGASPRGALGYLVAALEIPAVPERIYVPLGTGTTVSGLLAGLMLRRARTEVVAVRVADALAGVPLLLFARAFAAVRLLHRFDGSVPRPRQGGVRLRVVRAEGEYGEPTEGALAAVRAARPLALEPTYTGKALAVLLEERAEGAMLLNTFAGPTRR